MGRWMAVRTIDWDSAYRLIADELRALTDPDEVVFYTSGRTSNEAAFLYQLMVTVKLSLKL